MARAVPSSQANRLSTAASIAFAIAALYFAREVLIPIALSVLLAFLLAPLVLRLQRHHIPRIPAVLAVVVVATCLVAVIGFVVGDQVVSLAQELPHYDEISHKTQQIRTHAGGWGSMLNHMGNAWAKSTSEVVPRPAGVPAEEPAPKGTQTQPIYTVPLPAPISPVKTLFEYLGFALSPLGTAALVLVFVIFILLEREDLRDRIIRVVSHGRYTVTTRAIDDAAQRISRYLLAQSIVNGTYGLVIGLGLLILSLAFGGGTLFPSFVLWGLLSATLRFIPYIGAWIAASFPILLSLAVYPGFEMFLVVLILLAGIELFTNNVMEPWLYGASTGLSTMAILIAAVFWTWLWGPVGLLLSTPLTVCIVVLGKHVASLKFLDVLLSDQAALPPAVSFYQRLLAGDRAEAAMVARQVATDRGSEHVADDVLIPALIMARRDRKNDDLTAEKETDLFEQVSALLPELRGDSSKANPPSDGTPDVLGIPAHHRAEELPLDMLNGLLLHDDARCDMLTTRMLPSEIEQRVQDEQPKIVFIAVLPPGGVPQARYLCRRLHRKFPELKIVVGYWGRPRNFDQLLVRFRTAGASYVTTSLLQARSQIASLLSRPSASTTPPVAVKPV